MDGVEGQGWRQTAGLEFVFPAFGQGQVFWEANGRAEEAVRRARAAWHL